VRLEAVVVLGDGDDVLRAGVVEEGGPGVRVKVLGFEFGNEVLVAEGGLGTVGGDVMLELGRVLDVHVAGVPLVAEAGDGVEAPVDEDAELGVLIPGGDLVVLEGAPVGAEGAGLVFCVDGFEEGGALFVVGADGVGPDFVVVILDGVVGLLRGQSAGGTEETQTDGGYILS